MERSFIGANDCSNKIGAAPADISKFWILDFGFRIGGIAALCPIINAVRISQNL
ncbi:hypothetical protein D1AOALGA4SA_7974 [Olavius algarvensis Delta 1 endosymbiont]|nr:hypothetical protein D1AOALGA4SA_7974 [Olavius algarvensis Delta 1 endosymbiont]